MSSSFESAFTPFPVLETDRLILREMRPEDAEDLFVVCSDHEWLRLWGFPVHRTVDDTRESIAMIKKAHEDRTQLRWGMCLRGSDRVIGSLGFFRFNRPHFRAEITAEQARNVSKNGYMTEAIAAMVKFGFEKLDLHSIEGNIDPDHHASIRMVERLGFQKEGHQRQNYFFQGKFYDTLLYSILSGRPAFRPWTPEQT